MNIPLSPCVPENLVSRDGFSRPVPRQPAHLHTQAESGAYLRDSSRVPRRRPFMEPPYAIGSVPSLSGHATAYRWRSLPRVRRHRASKPQGSSERVLPWQVTMDQLIFASLSHNHYWYEALYGCSTWTLCQEHYAKLRTVHHQILPRIIGAQRKRPKHWMTSYNRALGITRCEIIETTLRTRRVLWAGTFIRTSGGRLPKRIVFGNLVGAVRRGRGRKEKKWTNCVQSDIRAFDIVREWKSTAL